MADQRTVTFSAPTGDVMSILGLGAQPVPPPSRHDPLSSGYSSSGSFPASPAATSSGSFPASSAMSSGSFPVAPAGPIHGAPTSDPFPAYNGSADPLSTTWTGGSAGTTSGSWAAASPDILDDAGTGGIPVTGAGPSGSWPAFEPQPSQPSQPSYPSSYEVRAGWAVADDSDALTGPSPVTGTPTVPARTVSAYDDVLSAPPMPAPAPRQAPAQVPFAYETGDFASLPLAQQQAATAWPEQPAANTSWPGYNEMYGSETDTRHGRAQNDQNNTGGHRRSTPEQEFPDYYR
jgi:hypothetical protein